jgi:hypothetical protein
MPPFVKSALLLVIAAAVLATSQRTGQSRVTTFTVPLRGVEEVDIAHPGGGTGDPNASGLVTLSIDPLGRQVCFDFRLTGISEPMMAHIHRGPPLRNGPPVIILFTGTGMSLTDCAPSTRSQLSEIVANPAGFYVSVDSTEFPDGALRGQL